MDLHEVVGVDTHLLQEEALVADLPVAPRRHPEGVLECARERRLGLEARVECDVQDARLRAKQSVERVGESPRSHVGHEGLAREAFEDPLEMPVADARRPRHLTQDEPLFEVRLDEVDATLDLREIVEGLE